MMGEAKALLDQKDLVGARAKFVEADKLKPSDEAKREIEKIDKGQKLGDILQAADRALKKGDVKEAARKYQEAADLDPADPDIQSALKSCLYSVKFGEAKALAMKKDFKGANDLLDECLKLMPDKEQEITQFREETKQASDYDLHVADGRKLIEKKQWDKARNEFLTAQKIKNNNEVQDLIKQTKCWEIVDTGKQLLARNELSAAVAQFKAAMREYDCQEVRDLIKETQKKIEAGNK